MKFICETIRLTTIAVLAPSLGFATLFFLDGSRIIKPGDMDKGVFFLIGFVVAIVAGIVLMRTWPSPYAKKPNVKNPHKNHA